MVAGIEQRSVVLRATENEEIKMAETVLRKYITVQFAVSSPIGEKTIRIEKDEVNACLSDTGVIHQANEVLRQAGSQVRICGSVEKSDGTWDNFII